MKHCCEFQKRIVKCQRLWLTCVLTEVDCPPPPQVEEDEVFETGWPISNGVPFDCHPGLKANSVCRPVWASLTHPRRLCGAAGSVTLTPGFRVEFSDLGFCWWAHWHLAHCRSRDYVQLRKRNWHALPDL